MYKTISRLITLIMATKRISSHLILYRYVLIINQTYLQLSWCSHECVSNFSQHSSYTTSLKKRSTDTYTGRCENMWLILKRDRKCQCHIWTSCWWRFAHFELAPDSTITNTTSSENLDVTEHPLFLIVNCHHNTMVCFSLNFQKSNEIYIKCQKSWIP
jgi:hypothetical protein